jgi:hypothetical protein
MPKNSRGARTRTDRQMFGSPPPHAPRSRATNQTENDPPLGPSRFPRHTSKKRQPIGAGISARPTPSHSPSTLLSSATGQAGSFGPPLTQQRRLLQLPYHLLPPDAAVKYYPNCCRNLLRQTRDSGSKSAKSLEGRVQWSTRETARVGRGPCARKARDQPRLALNCVSR